MTESTSTPTIDGAFRIEGNTLTLKVGDYTLSLKIEGPQPKLIGRLQMEPGQTLFDVVLEAATASVRESGGNEFTAANLYHIAQEKHPDLEIKRNSWNSHIMSSTRNHPSYRHYTSHRDYFRYLYRGKYALTPDMMERVVNRSS